VAPDRGCKGHGTQVLFRVPISLKLNAIKK
jgi:hypothetical protein